MTSNPNFKNKYLAKNNKLNYLTEKKVTLSYWKIKTKEKTEAGYREIYRRNRQWGEYYKDLSSACSLRKKLNHRRKDNNNMNRMEKTQVEAGFHEQGPGYVFRTYGLRNLGGLGGLIGGGITIRALIIGYASNVQYRIRSYITSWITQ